VASATKNPPAKTVKAAKVPKASKSVAGQTAPEKADAKPAAGKPGKAKASKAAAPKSEASAALPAAPQATHANGSVSAASNGHASPASPAAHADHAASTSISSLPSAFVRGKVAESLKLAGQETRLSILVGLVDGPKDVTSVIGMLNSTQPAVSHHLALMKLAGLVKSVSAGRNNVYSLTEAGRTLDITVKTLAGTVKEG
jgi:DNA-binding transcriptional ArsR family regulator